MLTVPKNVVSHDEVALHPIFWFIESLAGTYLIVNKWRI